VCGRYALNISGDDLALEFAAGIKDATFSASNWNISPTTAVPFINASDEKGEIRNVNTANWGLIPSWAKDASRASNAINARVESISEKPTFKSAFKSRRCLIPVTGYYEWSTELGKYKPKQPFYISHKNKSSLAIAGLYENWINPESKQSVQSAAIDDYLNMIDIKEADKDLIFWPVSDDVNNARNTGADLAKEIALGESGTLF